MWKHVPSVTSRPNFGLSLDVETCEPPLLVVLELL